MKPFQCKYCMKEYSTKDEFMDHIRVHRLVDAIYEELG